METDNTCAAQMHLLFVDGHSTNIDKPVMHLCYINKLYLQHLAPSTSSLTWPLDIECFSSIEDGFRWNIEPHIAKTLNIWASCKISISAFDATSLRGSATISQRIHSIQASTTTNSKCYVIFIGLEQSIRLWRCCSNNSVIAYEQSAR